jgi:hypothetical protein
LISAESEEDIKAIEVQFKKFDCEMTII